jgi:hypothetical protein
VRSQVKGTLLLFLKLSLLTCEAVVFLTVPPLLQCWSITGIEGVIQNNPKARANPKALAQLDGYKRPLVGSLSMNLQRFGMERAAKLESLQEIIAEMRDTEDNSATAQSE